MAPQLRLGTSPVLRYLRRSTCAERTSKRRGHSILPPDTDTILQPWHPGCHDALQLLHRRQQQGSQGSAAPVARSASASGRRWGWHPAPRPRRHTRSRSSRHPSTAPSRRGGPPGSCGGGRRPGLPTQHSSWPHGLRRSRSARRPSRWSGTGRTWGAPGTRSAWLAGARATSRAVEAVRRCVQGLRAA